VNHLLLAWWRVAGSRIDAEDFSICEEGKIGVKKLSKVFDLVMSKVDDDAMILVEEGITLVSEPCT
jgi:hypothetical protein